MSTGYLLKRDMLPFSKHGSPKGATILHKTWVLLTSDKGQQILSGGCHEPPIAACHLSVQRALVPVHVSCQQPEVPRNCPPCLHQLVRMRQPACVDPLQQPPPYPYVHA